MLTILSQQNLFLAVHTHTLCSKQVPRVCRITFYKIADTY